MNERIKKIAERATVYREGLVDGKYDIEFFDKEKFAELIVKECCYIVGDYYGQSKKSGPGYTMICEIKEHFGVE